MMNEEISDNTLFENIKHIDKMELNFGMLENYKLL